MDVRVGPYRRLSTEKLMLLNLLEKTLESPLDCKEITPVSPKGNQSWMFIGRTDAEAEAPVLWLCHAKNWLIRKDPDGGKGWRQEEKRTTEDEMIGWYHWLDGYEFEQAPEVGDGQGSLACCSPWGHSWTQLNDWTELAAHNVLNICFCMVMHTESGVSDYSFFISL